MTSPRSEGYESRRCAREFARGRKAPAIHGTDSRQPSPRTHEMHPAHARRLPAAQAGLPKRPRFDAVSF